MGEERANETGAKLKENQPASIWPCGVSVHLDSLSSSRSSQPPAKVVFNLDVSGVGITLSLLGRPNVIYGRVVSYYFDVPSNQETALPTENILPDHVTRQK